MGLLDVFNSDEGRLGLGLLAAAGPRADGAGFGQRLQEGMGSVDAWKQNKAKQAYLDMQMQEMKKKQDEEANGLKWREGLPAVMGNPQALQSYLLSPNSPFASKVLERQLFPKEAEPYTLGEGQVRFGPNNQQLAQGPAKVDKEPDAIRQLKAIYGDGTPAYQAALQQYGAKMTTHQPSTVVNTGDNLGLKPKDRFDMEGKLRADYEKLTQSDNEIVGVAQDISGLFKQGGALKDQAAIYKFAKSLDPQGAVREADYAAIIRTAGGLDYVTGLVNKALTGEQLSPKQRIEMERVVNSMADVAKKRIGAVQKRTTNNAKMYNLEPANLFAPREEVGQNPPSDPLGIRKK